MTAARIFPIAGFAAETEDIWAIIFLEIAGVRIRSLSDQMANLFYRDCGIRNVDQRQVVSELAGRGEICGGRGGGGRYFNRRPTTPVGGFTCPTRCGYAFFPHRHL